MPTKIMTRLLAGTAVSALLTGAAFAADANARPYDIPQQDAATALQAYAMQSGKQVLFPYEAAKGKQAPQIKGDFSDQEVLALLAGSAGLRVTADDGKTVTLRPQVAAAAEGGDEGTVQALIVTAQKREEDIQDVPIAISAFTQEDLTRSQVAGGPDLMTQVPNFTFTKTNFSSYSIQIRGIGTQAISATVDPAVAVAFNNTPFIRNRFFEQEFYDLKRIEVLRGPQGTLYGRNATAGVINIISAPPKPDQFEARLSGDVSNYNSSRLEGMVNLPLVEDKAALRVAGAWTKRDGYVTNIVTGDQTDGRDLWSARVTLGLTPTDWFKANLIYEHFSENDDRLRSGKQLCHTDPGPMEINGVPVGQTSNPLSFPNAGYWTQGCKPASLYSPDSFETPNGYALGYASSAGIIGAPIDYNANVYLSKTQSRNLREIETRIKPEYTATNDTVELQLEFDLPGNLTLASETGFNHDKIFSYEDFNRFNTTPGIFIPSGYPGILRPDGTVCDPQLGCSDRVSAGDLSTGDSQQFSQEFRVSSNFEGPFNFSLGANVLRFDTEEKYYIFFNTLGPAIASYTFDDIPFANWAWGNPLLGYQTSGFVASYADLNDIHNLNDEGRNYFLSKNPYHLLSYAMFGEAYWQIRPNLKLTAGLRWTDDRKSSPQIPSWLLAGGSYGTPTLKVVEQEWREPTGRLAIDWKPQLGFTDETLLYASYTRGYKAGGANPPGFVVTSVPAGGVGFQFQSAVDASLHRPETFEPEFVDAYEVGTKNTVLDGRLTFNLAAFYYDYTGYQISQIVDRAAENLNFDVKIWGAELETDWRPLENLRFGFKLGYENTRMADGSAAVDLIDRTAGMPGWLVMRPFPTLPASCIIPESLALVPLPESTDISHPVYANCFDYKVPGRQFWDAPNHGAGFSKDLSGNSLPNAPHFTATLTGDFTLPLPSDWLMTLHTDLYYQSEAWTRIFNTPGYDKLKAFNNINVTAIFSNQDAGWTVMAYVKNLQNKDNITGAFLNSDDTGLTTNVFLNEPRLFGLRVTKNWTGQAPLGGWLGAHTPGEPYPLRVEFEGYYGPFGMDHERFAPPITTMFNADFPHPDDPQSDLDWGSGGGVRFTYTPSRSGWNVSAGVRYGRAQGKTEAHAQQNVPEECFTFVGYPVCFNFSEGTYTFNGTEYSGVYRGLYNVYNALARNEESHVMADFMVGRDFGIGSAPGRLTSSTIKGGIAYAHLESADDLVLHARPDTYFPSGFSFYPPTPHPPAHVHSLDAELETTREFTGGGPALEWDGSIMLAGDPDETGRIGIDIGLGASILFGKQKTNVHEHRYGIYWGGYDLNPFIVTTLHGGALSPPYDTTFNQSRTEDATVPTGRADLGLSYELGRLKIVGGYRWERYFKAVDAGLETRKTYDRTFEGPYFKVSIGFGG